MRLVLAYVLTGRRCSEVLNLRWRDLDLEGRFHRYTAKGGKERQRAVPPPSPSHPGLLRPHAALTSHPRRLWQRPLGACRNATESAGLESVAEVCEAVEDESRFL